MRRRLFLVIAILLIGAILTSSDVFAASCGGVETSILECEDGGNGGIYHILSLVIDIMVIGVGILGVLGVSWAGVQYMTAAGDIARATKAKRRIFEIIIGMACFVVIWSGVQWLSPSSTTAMDDIANADGSSTTSSSRGVAGSKYVEVKKIKIAYSGDTFVDETFMPKVTFNKSATNQAYTLSSNKKAIASISSSKKVKCLKVGKATITATASSNGMKASMTIQCKVDSNVKTVGSMAGIKLDGKPNFRKETRNIINDHRLDFNSSNYSSKIKKYGGYNKYVKSLGGVFEKYYNTDRIKVKTAADFQEASEYVMGLLTIWGVDYNNNSYYRPWRYDSAWSDTGKSDRFYAGRGNWVCSYRGHISVSKKLKSGCNVVNCNDFVDTIIHTTKLHHIAAASSGQSAEALSKYKTIKNVSNLRVGDVVHFYGSSSGPSNGSNWWHVAVVGEVYKDYVVLYDGGRAAIGAGVFKHVTKRVNGRAMTDHYGGYGTRWIAIRPWNIDQSLTMKGIN